MSRLEELHTVYEENQNRHEEDWVFVYNDLPDSRKLVHLWIHDSDGTERFFVSGRYSEKEGIWMDAFYNWVNWNVVAWRDIPVGSGNA